MGPISAQRHAMALCDPRRGCGLFPDRLDRDLADDAAIYGILDDRNFARGGQGHRSSGGRARGWYCRPGILPDAIWPAGIAGTFRARRNAAQADGIPRSEEHTSELQSLMRNSYA